MLVYCTRINSSQLSQKCAEIRAKARRGAKSVDRGATHPTAHLRTLDIASAAHQLGSFLSRFRVKVLGISQKNMAERLSQRLKAAGRKRGVSETTYRKLESGDLTVNFTYWLVVFQEFGTL